MWMNWTSARGSKSCPRTKAILLEQPRLGPCNQQALRLYHGIMDPAPLLFVFSRTNPAVSSFQERVVFTFKGDLMQAMKDASQTLAKVGPGFHPKEATSQWPFLPIFQGHSLERPAEASAGRSETLEKSR